MVSEENNAMSTCPKLTERRMTVYDASMPSSHSLSRQAASCHCQVDPAAARQARAIAITSIACRYASRGDSPAHGLLVKQRRPRPIFGTGARLPWLAPPAYQTLSGSDGGHLRDPRSRRTHVPTMATTDWSYSRRGLSHMSSSLHVSSEVSFPRCAMLSSRGSIATQSAGWFCR
jgi:hypothetical protein